LAFISFSTSAKTNIIETTVYYMGDPNPLLQKVSRLLGSWRQRLSGGEGGETSHGESLPLDLLDSKFLGFLYGREMPEKCKVFLGFVNVLVVAVVVGLALENASPKDPQLQRGEDDHGKVMWQCGWFTQRFL
jgi:hypothetical protein